MKTMLRTFALTFATLALGIGLAGAQSTPKGLQVPGGATEDQPAGTVPWQLLQQAKTVQNADKKFGPVFTKEINQLDKPLEFTYEPIVVAGRLAVLEDDVVYYRLTNASAVQP